MIKVTIIQHTPEPEKTVALAARLCYSASDIASLGDGMSADSAEKLVRKLRKSGHATPFEHASFTFGIEGVSRAATHQLVRHRLASYSQQSQRYVKFDESAFVAPPAIMENAEAREKTLAHFEASRKLYDELTAMGIKKEDARYVLPEASASKIIVTMNARELFHFFQLRCCNRAQWEIRDLATQMLRLARGVAPLFFMDSGPRCLGGPCPEGEFSCKQAKSVRKFFAEITG